MFEIFFLLALGVVLSGVAYAFLKVRKANLLLDTLAVKDKSWDRALLKARVEEVHNAVLNAVEKVGIESVKGVMTRRMFGKLKAKPSLLTGPWKGRSFSNVKGPYIAFLEVEDYNNDDRDRVGAYITYLDPNDNAEHIGPPSAMWEFVRGSGGWVLDDVDPNFNPVGLLKSKVYSEELTVKANQAKMEVAAGKVERKVEAEAPNEERSGHKRYKTGRKGYK